MNYQNILVSNEEIDHKSFENKEIDLQQSIEVKIKHITGDRIVIEMI